MNLNIAPGLKLPIAAVTETFAIVARRGAGKTHTGVVLAEEMIEAKQQIVVLDPLGVWWGLRSTRDGQSEGFPLVVFGGDHGDVPLTEHMGTQVASVIVAQRFSAIVDLSTLSKSAARRFATDFAERLYEAKAPESQRTPLHLFIDEADMFIPQRVMPDQTRMLGAFETFSRRGRVRGFGVTLITQRPATLNKDVLTQTEILITLQITGPQDRKAVQEWVEAHDDGNHKEEFLKSLAGLQRGQAWVWSPSTLNVFQLVHIRQRETFDSSRTPTAGVATKGPQTIAKVDLAVLREELKQVLEEQEQNNPAKLKAKIRELEAQLKAKPVAPPHDDAMAIAAAIAIRDSQWRLEIDRVCGDITLPPWRQVATAAASMTGLQFQSPVSTPPAVVTPRLFVPTPTPQPVARKFIGAPVSGSLIGRGERAILSALAQAAKPRSSAYVGIVTGYSSSSGTFATYLSRLRASGCITGSGSALSITEKGCEALGKYEPLPSGDALIFFWLNKLGKGEAAILRCAVDNYPNGLTAEAVGRITGYSYSSGTFATYLSRLRTLCLIEGRGEIKATPELMGAV